MQGQNIMKWQARLIFVNCLVLLTVSYAFSDWEESLTFFPSKYPDGNYHLTESPHVTIEDVAIFTSDGVKLHGWISKPKRLKGRMWLLWFPGNGGNVSYRLDWIKKMSAIPLNVLIIDYRGYGQSEGSPTEEGIYRDAEAGYAYLTKKVSVSPENIVLFGESLGGAVAIHIAANMRCAGLIVQSTFTNAKDMAKRIMPIIPLWLIIKTKLDSTSKIQNVKVPKLFIHSPADGIVPYKLGRKLFDSAPEPKKFYEVSKAGHNETYLVGGQEYFNSIRDFVFSLHQSGRR
jgi:uncharacterized protein